MLFRVLGLSIGLCSLARAQVVFRDVEAYTAKSPSGEFSVRVIPGERSGQGPCTLSMTRHRRVVWTKPFPSFLASVAVDDHGNFCGYDDANNFIDIEFFNRHGHRQAKESVLQHDVAMTDSGPAPWVTDFVCDPIREHVVVRTHDITFGSADESFEWRAYDLRTGKRLVRKHSKEEIGGEGALFTVEGTEGFFNGFLNSKTPKPIISAYDVTGKLEGTVVVSGWTFGDATRTILSPRFKPDGYRKIRITASDGSKSWVYHIVPQTNGRVSSSQVAAATN